MARWLLKGLQTLMIHWFRILFPSPGEHISEETMHSSLRLYTQYLKYCVRIDMFGANRSRPLSRKNGLFPDIRDLELLDTIPALHHGRGVGNPRWESIQPAGGVLEGIGAISEQNIMKIVEVGGHRNRWFCGMKKSWM